VVLVFIIYFETIKAAQPTKVSL